MSIVSHELRTPLTSIKGALGLLIARMDDEMPADIRALVDIAHNNCNRMIRLIADMLDVNTIATGKFKMNFRPVSLAEIVESEVAANELYARQFGVTLETGQLPANVMVHGDEDRLAQVFTQLLSVAVRVASSGRTVTVAGDLRPRTISISIAVPGPGIPAGVQARLFEGLAVSPAYDDGVLGLGLGLAVSKRVVEDHGGKIGCETTNGGATIFHVELPTWPENRREE